MIPISHMSETRMVQRRHGTYRPLASEATPLRTQGYDSDSSRLGG